jgi:Ca-activated chloride channel homolog
MDAARQPLGESAMTFARPDLLAFAVLVPLLLGIAVWLFARRRRRTAAAFSDAHLLERLGGADLLRFPAVRLVLITLGGASLALALAGPRWGTRTAEGRALSLNVVVAADISRSMLAEDIEPNRLERARLFARRLLRELPGDRFGLVVFAGRAYVLSPLTVDHGAIELYIDALDPNMVSQGGSSLSAALMQATDLARGSQPEGGDRIVVLLSDGEALEELDAVSVAADRAARAGVRVLTVGFGTPRGSTIPDVDPTTGTGSGVRRDPQGEVVVTRLEEDVLRMIASRTGGRFVRADEAGGLNRVVGELRGMQRGQGDSATRVEPRDRYALFAALGLLLLAADMLLVAYSAQRRARTSGSLPGDSGTAVRPRRRRPPRRLRSAAIVALLGAVLGFGIGDLERGNRMYRAGRYEEAAEAYLRVLDSGKASPQVHYNLGTALLALGRHVEAERQFQAALQGVNPELRQRAFYNMGNRFLDEGRSGEEPERQAQLLDAAIEAYRGALRIAPDDTDAKWNLELALREREKNEQQRSLPQQSPQQDEETQPQDDDQQQAQGAGSGASPSQSGAGQGDDQGMSPDQQPMSREQAEQILSAMEQDERELTREKLRRGQQRTPVLRDW